MTQPKHGLSPRGRGKPFGIALGAYYCRSIPAWAGETKGGCDYDIREKVYPRVGGGNGGGVSMYLYPRGLSPRGRGKLSGFFSCFFCYRSIPAWAGETRFSKPGDSTRQVYPRVGGGNYMRARRLSLAQGLSPRGRGKLNINDTDYVVRGSIPAWAGETYPTGLFGSNRRVYPRVGGGNDGVGVVGLVGSGLSPRGRGKQAHLNLEDAALRSIPAWAGETHIISGGELALWVYPRVGGGNDAVDNRTPFGVGLSPRGRGKRGVYVHPNFGFGSIPAWAGETFSDAAGLTPVKVYPRVGGGNSRIFCSSSAATGLSPRGRGKPQGRR